MKRPIDKDVVALMLEMEVYGRDEVKHWTDKARSSALNAKKVKKTTLPASGAELDEDLPDLSPGVKDKK